MTRPAWFWPLLAAACLLAFGGWWLFWYQCDDAYIAFRYVSNRQDGWGYVWNPPPFAPVEGYTSFLWVVLLDAVWTLTGLEPPAVATWLDLGFTFARLALIAEMARRLPLAASLEPYRPHLTALVLVGIVSNTTFLAWTSSGLETPMFDFFLLAWAYWSTFAQRSASWSATGAGIATLITLTRPDGLLFLAATPVVVAAHRMRTGWRKADAWALVPPLAVVAHLLWRHATYGFWLPNTYYAKHLGPWPGAGGNYFWLFVIEYTWWLQWPLMAWALHRHRDALKQAASWWAHAPSILAGAAFVAHGAYYIVMVGGDHFEYRIFLHWVSLFWLAWPWLMGRLAFAPKRAAVWGLAALLGASWLSWADWAQMRQVDEKIRMPKLRLPLAQNYPPPVSVYVGVHDFLEDWLASHTIRISHQTHRLFRTFHQENFPTREESIELFPKSLWTEKSPKKKRYPTINLGSVGVAGWRMPYVAIIDRMGLNDRVTARNPPPEDWYRYMAHDRRPAPGYVECFKPNVKVFNRPYKVKARKAPLTAKQIRECEAVWLEKALNGTLPPHARDEPKATEAKTKPERQPD